jgi:hypothetical protein
MLTMRNLTLKDFALARTACTIFAAIRKVYALTKSSLQNSFILAYGELFAIRFECD